MRKLFFAVAAIMFLLVGCGYVDEPEQLVAPSPPSPEVIYSYEDEKYPSEPPFVIIPRAEWCDFYGDEFFFNRDEYIEALFESARSVTTLFENSPFTTLHRIEPYVHELVEPWFELRDEIIVNGKVIDVPAPVWKHLSRGSQFIGHYQGATVHMEVLLPVIMLASEVAKALGYEVVQNGDELTIGEYRFQIGEMEGYCIETGRRVFLSAPPVVYNDMVFIPASFFDPQVFDGQIVFSPYSLNRIGEIIIGIAVATDERNYDSFAELIEFECDCEGPHELIIVPNMPLYDFRWIGIGHSFYDFYFYNTDIYEAGEITPTRPFLVTWRAGGTFPHRGISFVDNNGVTRYFSLNTNNACFDESPWGRYVLSEFLPGIPFREFWGQQDSAEQENEP